MCGRINNQFTWRELVELYRITEPYIRPVSNLQPRFNFAPMQRGIVVRLDKQGRREPVTMRWGLVPGWARDDSGAARCINAKAETVAEKPAFRAAFKARRCPRTALTNGRSFRSARNSPSSSPRSAKAVCVCGAVGE
jgi:putative SOS response-associated peptidase YedK